MHLGKATIGNLSRMICGDLPFQYFPYRSSSRLTAFFEGLNMDYEHDGSTRYYWVKSVLEELSQRPSPEENKPSDEISKIIEYLLSPDLFIGQTREDRNKAINKVNEILSQYELEVIENPDTHIVNLTISGDFISTASEKNISGRKITFIPSVFNVPEEDSVDNLVSVMIPFAAEYNTVYDAIRQTCNTLNLTCYRADDLWANSTIIQDIFDLLFVSHIVIVDYTGRNPNVLYETGIAHTLGKVVIPITQSYEDIPSDLKPHRALKYLPNNEGLEELKDGLTKRIRTILEGHSWK